jgi:hypothetical protein
MRTRCHKNRAADHLLLILSKLPFFQLWHAFAGCRNTTFGKGITDDRNRVNGLGAVLRLEKPLFGPLPSHSAVSGITG